MTRNGSTRGSWNGRPTERLKAQVFAEETHCWICGQWVDQDLPPTHPRSRTVDHVHERWRGGDSLDRNNCRLAHRGCNTRKSNQQRWPDPPRPVLTTDIGQL